MPFPLSDTLLILPELFLTTAGLVLLLRATAVGKAGERSIALLSVASLVVTGLLLWVPAALAGGAARPAFGGMIAVDRYSAFFKVLVLVAAAVTILFSLRFLGTSPYPSGEYYGLILFSTVGMLFMAAGTHLASIYVALELMALSQYVLAGYFKQETKSIEAAAKYFILGAFSSGILLYGLSLVYGATGTLDLAAVSQALAQGPRTPLMVVGVVLVACGLFFKIASAPFHVWAPDVYEGAPTPISAFFAVGPKLAAYAILARIFFEGFGPSAGDWSRVVAASAALTMVVGNVGALMQSNVKRMLGYSSIGHAGYALLGLLGYGTEYGLWSILIYLTAYALMNLGAFGLVVLLEAKGYAGESVDDFNGLAKKNPWAAAAMVVFLLSLAGIPPTAGFVGKYFLFSAAMKAGWVWLAILAVLMSVVSLFYYFRIARAMYLVEGEGELKWREEPAVTAAIAVCAAGTLLVGILPQPLVALARTCLLP
ncbi:NADH-quinone oxidoreductase subunit N [Acidobacteria bacterium ACD]|nr:MAG: NADH-quinone oxidoreductase subunit N [Acidobacteriota bacterium]MCE7957527.1 NADH-quinone oxidoreductase subunit N [Acidobacteria bacterium ACB2]MDL1948311.1 NADH-quinone oxidoreductase subunit N [Acidobacteria bacterium ACD]